MATAMLACGCAQILGIEDLSPADAAPALPVDAPPQVSPDAGRGGYAVRGAATGVLSPVALELRIGGETELLAVTQEGAFAFATRLETGTSYTVVLVDPDVPCSLRNQTGVIEGADTVIELTCTGASLASVVVSGVAPVIRLMPGTAEYVIDLPLSQTAVTVTATVAMAGDTLTIEGMPVASGTPSTEILLSLGANAVDIVVENALGWQRTYRLTLRRAAELAQYAYGKASNTDANDHFGVSVALSGDTLAVGAYQEDSGAQGVGGNQDDDGVTNSGAVYIFRRMGMAWQQEAYLKASNPGAGDHFGYSVALSGDILAVGAYQEDSGAQGVGGNQADNSATNSGAVYVFRRSGTAWQQEAYLKASNASAGDIFGYRLALSDDTLAVGAHREDSEAQGVGGNQAGNSATNSGAVYVFRRTGIVWHQEGYLKASNTGAGDEFGWSVALAGETLAVGASGEDSGAQGVGGNQTDDSAAESGAVYVFRRTGTVWHQEGYLKASNTGAGDNFGIYVALSGDTLAVGAHQEDSAEQSNQDGDGAVDSGAVYVFRRVGTAWEQEAYLKASNTGVGDLFGYRLALSGDTLAVGAHREDSAARGSDGNQFDDSTSDSGAVYVFRRTGTVWQQEAYLKASNTGAGDAFGIRIALSSDTLAIGAHQEDSAARSVDGEQDDDSASESGAVYIFH